MTPSLMESTISDARPPMGRRAFDRRSLAYANLWLRSPSRLPPPDLRFWYREPGLWLPLSCAIARVNAADLGLDTGGTSPYTASYTVGSGTNRALIVSFFGFTGGGADQSPTATYGGVSMTRIAWVAADIDCYSFYLLNPASGANNVVITFASPPAHIRAQAADYTGVLQSGQPDASGTANQASGTSLSKAITVVAANSWVMAFAREDTGTTMTWTNATELAAGGGIHSADSNGAVASGSDTVTGAVSGGTTVHGLIVWSLSPDTGGGAGFLARSSPRLTQAVQRASTY